MLTKYIGMFLLNDTDDEVLKELEEDEVLIDTSKIIAAYRSKYKGFIVVQLEGGSNYSIKAAMENFE